MKPGECAATILADPICVIAEVRNYSDPQYCPMSNLCRPMLEIFVSRYIEIYMGYIDPFPIEGQGARLPEPPANHTSPNITDLIMPPLDM